MLAAIHENLILSMNYAVIMAGGVGSRFWPSSRSAKPKQFLSLVGEKTMIQETVDRISPLIPHDRILIITSDRYLELVREQLPEIPSENIIGEPVARNTAPCVALAAALLIDRDPDATMVVLPADHYITRPAEFRKIIGAGIRKAQEAENLVTIGITPNRPETGYGYIQLDESEKSTTDKMPCYHVKTFAEKPDLKTAVSFIESGDFLWNSGMFIWKAQTIMNQFQEHQPGIFQEAEAFRRNSSKDFDGAVHLYYKTVTSISIDYGIMEKAGIVYVIPGDFGWSDVGSWMAVYELGKKDRAGNVFEADHVTSVESTNCLVRSDSEKLFALVGLMGIGVIETDDAILITRLDSSQDVKKVYDNFDSAGKARFK